MKKSAYTGRQSLSAQINKSNAIIADKEEYVK